MIRLLFIPLLSCLYQSVEVSICVLFRNVDVRGISLLLFFYRVKAMSALL